MVLFVMVRFFCVGKESVSRKLEYFWNEPVRLAINVSNENKK